MIIYMKSNYIHRPGRKSIAPGERFDPEGIIEAVTLKGMLQNGVAVEEKDPEEIAKFNTVDIVATVVADVPELPEAVEEEVVEEEEVKEDSDSQKLAEFCDMEMADIKNLKRAELDAIVDSVFEAAEVEKGDIEFPNIETVLKFLTGQITLEDI